MTAEKVEELRRAAQDIERDIAIKVGQAEKIIEQANKDRAEVLKLREGLRSREAALEQKAKKLKFLQLRLHKLVEEKQLDESLKRMIKEAFNG